jgi:glutathione S-transferase
MKLYTHPISLFPLRVVIALHEKALAYEQVLADLKEPSSQLLELNPFAQIPVLEDGGFAMAESMAILEYLDEKFPTPALAPKDVESRATMRKLMCWSSDYWYQHWKNWLAPRLGERGEPWTVESVESARRGLCTHLDVMDRQLVGRDWLVGEYSLADICYAPLVLAVSQVDFAEEIEARPRVLGWLNRLRSRKAVVESLLVHRGE